MWQVWVLRVRVQVRHRVQKTISLLVPAIPLPVYLPGIPLPMAFTTGCSARTQGHPTLLAGRKLYY